MGSSTMDAVSLPLIPVIQHGRVHRRTMNLVRVGNTKRHLLQVQYFFDVYFVYSYNLPRYKRYDNCLCNIQVKSWSFYDYSTRRHNH